MTAKASVTFSDCKRLQRRGLNRSEIARALGVSPSVVTDRLTGGRARLPKPTVDPVAYGLAKMREARARIGA